MHVICTAIAGNEMQMQNLCECIDILGGKPTVTGGTAVCVEYEGEESQVDKFIELFEQYTCCEIRRQK